MNTAHLWLWFASALSYSYVIHQYYFTDIADKSKSDFMKCWIPLDIMLMFFVAIYYFFQKYMQYLADKPIEMFVNDEGEAHAQSENFLTNLAKSFERVKDTKDSIYDADTPKVEKLKLNNDSNALGYAAFIDKEILGMDLSSE